MISVLDGRFTGTFDPEDVFTHVLCDTQGCNARAHFREGLGMYCADCHQQIRTLEQWEIKCAWRRLRAQELAGQMRAAVNRVFAVTWVAWPLFVLGGLAYAGWCWGEGCMVWLQVAGIR